MSFADIHDQDDTQGYEIAEYPKYLSPSSFKMWRRCKTEFYLKRMSPIKRKIARRPQGIAAAVGNGFDSFIKTILLEHTTGEAHDAYEFLGKSISNKEYLQEASHAGKRLASIYIQTAYESLLLEKPHSFDLEILEDFEGIPIRGFVDLLVGDKEVLDWKTRGYGGAPKSPTPGWCKKWKGGVLQNVVHKRHKDPLETLNEDWALQVAMYAFALGHEPGDHLTTGIDELSMRNVAHPDEITLDSVCVTQIRTYISPSFQHELAADLHNAWRDITRGEFGYCTPAKNVCYRFRQLCEASGHCEAFKRFQPIILGGRSPKTRDKGGYSVSDLKRMLGEIGG